MVSYSLELPDARASLRVDNGLALLLLFSC